MTQIFIMSEGKQLCINVRPQSVSVTDPKTQLWGWELRIDGKWCTGQCGFTRYDLALTAGRAHLAKLFSDDEECTETLARIMA